MFAGLSPVQSGMCLHCMYMLHVCSVIDLGQNPTWGTAHFSFEKKGKSGAVVLPLLFLDGSQKCDHVHVHVHVQSST